MDRKDFGKGIPLGEISTVYGRVFGDSPCDQMEKAIWDSNASPEDRLILLSRLKSIRRELQVLGDRVDHSESDLH